MNSIVTLHIQFQDTRILSIKLRLYRPTHQWVDQDGAQAQQHEQGGWPDLKQNMESA